MVKDWLITLSVLYGVGAIASIWATLFSPTLLDWWDTPGGLKKKDQRDWATIFLVLLLVQPVTFAGSAFGMWWIGPLVYIPPIHLVITVVAFLAIDFFRPDTDLSSKYKYNDVRVPRSLFTLINAPVKTQTHLHVQLT